MLAILGGTFDPIHFGHLRPAVEIYEKLDLSELRFIPSAKPPHRWQPEASAEHRINMVRKAIKAYPQFVLDLREYDRLQQHNQASYSIDTVASIRAEIGADKPLCMIVGMDAFQSFTQWRDWEKILEHTHLVVATRPGYDVKQQAWMQERVTADRSVLHKEPAGRIYFCDVTQLEISATFIREQIKAGQSVSYLTPNKIVRYIDRHKLYAST